MSDSCKIFGFWDGVEGKFTVRAESDSPAVLQMLEPMLGTFDMPFPQENLLTAMSFRAKALLPTHVFISLYMGGHHTSYPGY